jgi:Mn2+/Fe2+ NRAMP family transporter
VRVTLIIGLLQVDRMRDRPDKGIPYRGVSASRPAVQSWASDTGPGLATLGSDNDPSGIATYTLAGAWFGYDLLWACVLSYPSMVALQLISTRVAAITGKGLTANMREHYSPVFYYFAVARFLLANSLNIAVDILAVGAAMHVAVGAPVSLLALACGAGSVALQWWIPYPRYARALQWLTLGLFAYAGVIFVIHVPWQEVALRAFVPRIVWKEDYITMLIAVLGTTVSPYLLFSQAQQEVHELKGQASSGRPDGRPKSLRRVRSDTLLRTALSNSAGLLMMIAAAGVLHAAHSGAGEPVALARVLEPLAHGYASIVLGAALIGTALLALPLLAGSAAEAVASSFDWPNGEPRDQRVGLLLIAITVLGVIVAMGLDAFAVDPIMALYWSAVVNGMTVTPVLVLLVLLGTRHAAVGDLAAHWSLRALSWLATFVTGAALTAHFVLEFW